MAKATVSYPEGVNRDKATNAFRYCCLKDVKQDPERNKINKLHKRITIIDVWKADHCYTEEVTDRETTYYIEVVYNYDPLYMDAAYTLNFSRSGISIIEERIKCIADYSKGGTRDKIEPKALSSCITEVKKKIERYINYKPALISEVSDSEFKEYFDQIRDSKEERIKDSKTKKNYEVYIPIACVIFFVVMLLFAAALGSGSGGGSSSSAGRMSDEEFLNELATDGSSVNDWYENEYLDNYDYPKD